MSINKTAYQSLLKELSEKKVQLIAVSKTKPIPDIKELYDLGQRDFGENYVQELVEKANELPTDIRWHFIGHLQTNKVKLIIPFVQLIQGVDSLKLLKVIDKEAGKQGRIINCLLQVYIATEETKFGLDEKELDEIINLSTQFVNVNICGLMGMASFSADPNRLKSEFRQLKGIFDRRTQPQTKNYKLQTLSMGMSSDYKIAIEEGSNMVRIGSLLFGDRV